jgi:hypothetical protein
MAQTVMVDGVARCSSNLEFIVKREKSRFETDPPDGALISADVISTPNGRIYGVPGHIPCDHVVRYIYENCVKEFDGWYSTKVVKRRTVPAAEWIQRALSA